MIRLYDCMYDSVIVTEGEIVNPLFLWTEENISYSREPYKVRNSEGYKDIYDLKLKIPTEISLYEFDRMLDKLDMNLYLEYRELMAVTDRLWEAKEYSKEYYSESYEEDVARYEKSMDELERVVEELEEVLSNEGTNKIVK